ncbi:helicase-related protein [Porphyromonas gulae]|uniref:Helicase n=1 Tax=Porphyromonas gulae TaxID=111105 RepID=A0A0A2F659_9PORP|nr:helicase-related protein [Porphyromonas gulae]KGN86496.1 helicase [Porphyromonas gulae]
MSTKFFNNNHGNTLFEKFKGIAEGMPNLHSFLAVVGYFRSSGYFKLRKELGDISEIKILVGINIDDIFRKHNKALLMLADEEKAKEIYHSGFKEDIVNALYSPEVEEGILQMCEDLVSGRLQMRIHATKNLHAKFYLCLPENHSEHSDGWVIMGSSNISDSGLGIKQPPQYELNVAMKDFDEVKYCSDEFWALWSEAIPLTAEDIGGYTTETYLGYQPTPYELYIKVLIDAFGDQIEDDFSIQLPDGVKDLKYQKDAVIQGYQMLMQHNGLFLADVVGLGKTMIATMIAKRFVEENGRNTNILVVYPPALEDNWKNTLKLFGIYKKAQFITNGSLSKILEGRDQYKDKEEFDLIIVDEAHGFRSDSSGKYDELQKICKSPCANLGFLKSLQKKVMLLSATPLNNRPDDLLNQLLLFQNSQGCTIDGIPNLKGFFTPLIYEYKKLMRERAQRDVTSEVDKIYEQIRGKVIDKITVRRTRNNILNDPDYKADIKSQGIIFPNILPPNELEYEMDVDTRGRFYETLKQLTDGRSENNPRGKGLDYARYRAVEFLKLEYRSKYKNAVHIGQTLAGIYRVHMVKRLESSFYAFKRSLRTLLRITNDMIKMFEENKVIIAPDLKVKDLQAKNMELDQIIEYAVAKGYVREDILFTADCFDPIFLNMLHHDREILQRLNSDWEQEQDDPKFDKFRENLTHKFFDKAINPSGKLVLFSESVDTLSYLYERLTKEIGRTDVLMVTAANRNRLMPTIKENFDANFENESTKYNIIITSDVLAEGVNLHRSNVIVNYDSPWNATRLMQRIGRVNRIGSVAPSIYNYMFYPSQQGDKEIQLYKNALVKLQGFHSAFGEDAQIYSKEEIVKVFKMFDNNVKDSIDKKIALLREVRDVYNSDRKLYHKIKALPMKSRVMREKDKHRGKSVIFVSSNVKMEFYLATSKGVEAIDFLDAVKYLKAKPEELPIPFTNEIEHYKHVNCALDQYTTEYVEAADTSSINRVDLDKTSLEANKFLRTIKQITTDTQLKLQCDTLIRYINEGIYSQLPRYLKSLSREYKNDRLKMKQEEYKLQMEIDKLIVGYQTMNKEQRHNAQDLSNPQIIISEYFK